MHIGSIDQLHFDWVCNSSLHTPPNNNMPKCKYGCHLKRHNRAIVVGCPNHDIPDESIPYQIAKQADPLAVTHFLRLSFTEQCSLFSLALDAYRKDTPAHLPHPRIYNQLARKMLYIPKADYHPRRRRKSA